MAKFANTMKDVLSCSAKIAGSAINRAAKAIKFKTNELTEICKRRELISELGTKVYELCRNGPALPEEAESLVNQITSLDNDLAALRANYAAQKEADAQKHAADKAAAKAAAVTEQKTASVDAKTPEMEVAEHVDDPQTDDASSDIP